MATDKETLNMLNEQRREISDRCREEGCFGNYSAIDILHIGITHFLKQYQYQESLIPLMSAYLGIAKDIIDGAISTNPDKATHEPEAIPVDTHQKEIDRINRGLNISEKEIERMKAISPVYNEQHQKTVRALKAEQGREYEKDIVFSHDYTPKFEVQDTLFEIVTVDTDAEGPVYPPLKALSKQREEEAHRLFYPLLIEKFPLDYPMLVNKLPLDKINLNTISLFNEFVSILTFFEDNRESFFRSITRGYITSPSGRQHGCYIDAINATNLSTPDNIRAKYRYTVNGSKVYYQFRIERPGYVEEFTLGKDENKDIAEIIEYLFTDGQRSITINMDSFTNAENIGPLSQFFVELAQSFDRRFDQR